MLKSNKMSICLTSMDKRILRLSKLTIDFDSHCWNLLKNFVQLSKQMCVVPSFIIVSIYLQGLLLIAFTKL